MNILGSSYAVPKFWGYITNKMKMEGLKSQNLYKQSSSPKQVQTSDCFHLALSTNEYQKIQFRQISKMQLTNSLLYKFQAINSYPYKGKRQNQKRKTKTVSHANISGSKFFFLPLKSTIMFWKALKLLSICFFTCTNADQSFSGHNIQLGISSNTKRAHKIVANS